MSKEKATTPVQNADSVPTADPNWPRDVDARLRRVGKANMEVTVVLGRTRLPLETILNAEAGSLIETDKVSGQPMDILVNGALFARGEIVVIGDNIAVRITDMVKPEDMVNG